MSTRKSKENDFRFLETLEGMSPEMRALFLRKAAEEWCCQEQTVRRRIKSNVLNRYEIKFVQNFCKKHNIVII